MCSSSMKLGVSNFLQAGDNDRLSIFSVMNSFDTSATRKFPFGLTSKTDTSSAKSSDKRLS